jgi:hypothetical protein
MASAAQITANQANVLHSTGPRSMEGKKKSPQNTRRHGFTSTQLVIPLALQAEFEKCQTDLQRDIRPEGAIEEGLFERLLLSAWNLRRITRRETELLDESNPFALRADVESSAFDRLVRYRRDLERSYHRTLAELRKLQTQRAALLQQPAAIVNAFYSVTPLADMVAITNDTDPLIAKRQPERLLQFYRDRESASRAAAKARNKPDAGNVAAQSPAAMDPVEMLKSMGFSRTPYEEATSRPRVPSQLYAHCPAAQRACQGLLLKKGGRRAPMTY